MRLDLKLSWVVVASLAAVACGTAEPVPEETEVTVKSVGQELRALGSPCDNSSQCASGLCVKLETSQAYWPWCFGSVCTLPCEGRGYDDYCQELAVEAGAPNPHLADCKDFNYGAIAACDLAAAGLGVIGCE